MRAAGASARELTLLVPGDLETATGGYRYDRRIAGGLQALGWQVRVCSLHTSFPLPDSAALAHADAQLSAISDRQCVLIDGLALGAMPEVVLRHARRLHLIGLVHHPLALETGLTTEQARQLQESERHALQAMRHIVVTSAETAAALQLYEVDAARITVIEPGTDASDTARHRTGRRHDTLSLLCVATLTPRKGHAALISALIRLPHRDWQLHCVGSTTRHADTTTALQATIAEAGLTQHIILHGEVDQATLQNHYQHADLLVQASHHEGYGMALAEALAQGLPALSTATGAAPRLLAGGAGLLVATADSAALQAALQRLWQEPLLLAQLGATAWRERANLPSWQQAIHRWDQVLRT
jgi:glycosyltransferase involved in cell wall biosynthesis